jgi:hypothetical protein
LRSKEKEARTPLVEVWQPRVGFLMLFLCALYDLDPSSSIMAPHWLTAVAGRGDAQRVDPRLSGHEAPWGRRASGSRAREMTGGWGGGTNGAAPCWNPTTLSSLARITGDGTTWRWPFGRGRRGAGTTTTLSPRVGRAGGSDAGTMRRHARRPTERARRHTRRQRRGGPDEAGEVEVAPPPSNHRSQHPVLSSAARVGRFACSPSCPTRSPARDLGVAPSPRARSLRQPPPGRNPCDAR